MKKLITTKNIVIFLIITLFVFLVSILYNPKTPIPTVISASPKHNSKNISVTENILVKFDQTVDLSKIVVTSVPEEEWSLKSSTDKSVVALESKQYLLADSDYAISIYHESQLVTVLNYKTIAQQGDPRYTQTVLKEMDRDYPLATKFPYSGPNFRLIYDAPLTIGITIKNPNLTSQEVIEEVKEWVSQNGLSSVSHKYIISTPSPSPQNTTFDNSAL